MPPIPKITAIVPTLNEEAALPPTLARLAQCGFGIIVVDGGSRDATVSIARNTADLVLSSPPGRARQMNLGAEHARGDVLFFVHADSRPPLNAKELIIEALARPGAAAGAFRLKIEPPRPLLSVIAALANLRSRLAGLPYGDQGLFVWKHIFEQARGYGDLPLMEDVDLVRRLKSRGRIVLARGSMSTSARRWEKRGALRNSLENLVRLWRFHRGAPPEKLARGYGEVR